MKMVEMIKAFSREEDGVALTEYLMLLGLLIAGVIAAVTAAGGNLSTAWESWGTFWTEEVAYDGGTGTDPEPDPGT